MKSILVVDDEVAIADVLAAILSDAGYDVILASNGKHALARLDTVTAQRPAAAVRLLLGNSPAPQGVIRNVPWPGSCRTLSARDGNHRSTGRRRARVDLGGRRLQCRAGQ